MANQDLVQYIQSQQARGVKDAAIQDAAAQAGWQQSDIDDAMAEVSGTPAAAPTEPTPAQPTALDQQQPAAEPTQPMQTAQPSTSIEVEDIFDLGGSMEQQEAVTPTQPVSEPESVTPEVAASQPMPTVEPAQEMNMMEAMPEAGMPSDQPATPEGFAQPLNQGEKPTVKNGMGTAARMALYIVIILVIGGIIGGGIYWYMNAFQSSNRVEQYVVANTVAARSVAFDVSVTPEFRAGESAANPITGTTPDSAAVQVVGTVDATQEGSTTMAAALIARLGSGADEEIYQAEARSVNGQLYTRITRLPESNDAVLETIVNEWIVFEDYGIQEIAGANADTALSGALTNTIAAMQGNSVFTLGDAIGAETIDGVQTMRYSMTLDATVVEDIARGAAIQLNAAFGQTVIPVTVAISQPITGEVWINESDYQIYRATMTIETPQQAAIASMDVELNLKDYNQPQQVVVPSGAKTLALILQDALLSDNPALEEELGVTIDNEEDAADTTTDTTTGDAEESDATSDTDTDTTTDTTTDETEETDTEAEELVPTEDPDEDGLTNAEEARYGTDPTNPDTDGDSFLDGEEIENDYNPLGPGRLSVK